MIVDGGGCSDRSRINRTKTKGGGSLRCVVNTRAGGDGRDNILGFGKEGLLYATDEHTVFMIRNEHSIVITSQHNYGGFPLALQALITTSLVFPP